GNGKLLQLPVAIAVILPPPSRSPLAVTATVTGSRSARTVATGAAPATVVSGQHQTIHVRLSNSTGAVLAIDRAPAYDYGTVNVGAALVQELTISNQGTQAAVAPNVSLSDTTHFTIKSNDCVGG